MKKIICILLTILIECSWILNGVTIKASEVSNVVYDEIFISRIFKFKLSGTVVITATGSIPIEQVHAGTIVQSFNPGTLVVSQKKVETTFEKQTSEIMHISVNKEIIDATTIHPFYVLDRGFVTAKNLRAGDILCTVDGDYVVVEQVQHEILESPVNANTISKFGGAYRIESIPPEIEIIQRGTRMEHYEIVPKYEMSIEEFQMYLDQIEISGPY